MDDKSIFTQKSVSLYDVPQKIAPNGRTSMFFSFCFGQPISMLSVLGNVPHKWEKITFITGMTLAPYQILKNPATRLISGYYSAVDRKLDFEGYNVDYFGQEFHSFFRPIVENYNPEWIATVSTPMDSNGFFNLGVTGDLTEWFIRHKIDNGWKTKILLEINENMPTIYGIEELGNHQVHINDVDICVVGAEKRKIPEYPKAKPTKEDLEIATFIEEIIPNGACIQIGIGRLPDAVGEMLEDKHDLGFHTEMLTSCVKHLVEEGAVTGKKKNLQHPIYKKFNDRVIFTFVGGTQGLYDFSDRNEELRCVPLNYLNDISIIRMHDNFISINAILGCDLRGQTISTAFNVDGKTLQYSGIGGQATFVRAALESKGGFSIQCMPSTREINGKIISNIYSVFPAGTPIGTPEYFCDYIVTEYGAAKLRHLSMRERAKALIKIAHPDFRDQLTSEAKEKKLF